MDKAKQNEFMGYINKPIQGNFFIRVKSGKFLLIDLILLIHHSCIHEAMSLNLLWNPLPRKRPFEKNWFKGKGSNYLIKCSIKLIDPKLTF